MPFKRMFIAFTLLAISSLACATIMGEDPSEADIIDTAITAEPVTEAAPAEEETEEAASCPVITDQIVSMNSPVDLKNQAASDFSNASDDEEEATYIVTYRVDGDQIVDPYYENVPTDLQDEQDDTAAHQALWNYYIALIPLEYRTTLAEFSIMTDGVDNVLAAVAQTYDDPNLWGLEVDIADTGDYYYLTFTLVHEFAHLLTLSPDQVTPSLAIFNNPDDNDIYLEEVSACSTFFPGEGCSNEDSYINAFYNEFWPGIYDEWNEINLEEDEDLYYEKLDEFYYKYEDQFLTDYSVTHPAEDIAEAFGFFVFAEKPDGDSVAEEKILFFYRYPELVQLRSDILSSVCENFPQ